MLCPLDSSRRQSLEQEAGRLGEGSGLSVGVKQEVVADRIVPGLACGERTSPDEGRHPEVTGAPPIEIEGGGDVEPGERLGSKGAAQCRERGLAGMTECPAGTPIPDEEGTRTGVLGVEAVDQTVIFDEEGAGLQEMAGRGEGPPVLAPEDARLVLHGNDTRGQCGLGVPSADMPAFFNYQSEGVALRGEEAAIDGRQSSMGLGRSFGGGPLGTWASRLVCDREAVVSCIKEKKGEINSPEGDSLDACRERDAG